MLHVVWCMVFTCAQAHAKSVWLLRHTLEEQLEQQRASLLVEIEASNVMPFPCRHACDPALPVPCPTGLLLTRAAFDALPPHALPAPTHAMLRIGLSGRQYSTLGLQP